MNTQFHGAADMNIRTLMQLALTIGAFGLTGCATGPSGDTPGSASTQTRNPVPRAEAPATGPAPKPSAPAKPGAFYLDDGPGDRSPADIEALPDAQPKPEPLHRFANRPYSVFGQEFVPEQAVITFRQRGMASWYGRRFHGNKTAIGEIYDMYQLSAAHPTLALPSYARVTNVSNGRQVIVRINDRGPFLRGRVIDLSYAAAAKLGYVEQGSTMVEIEAITPETMDALAARGTPAPVGGPQTMLEPRGNQRGFPLFTEREGVFVQLGAFAMPDNAESLRARLALEMSAVVRSVQVVLRNGLHRIWAGPFGNQNEARLAAERIAAQLR